MDVNNLAQKSINLNNYQNTNVSDYTTGNTETSGQQVQKIETQSQDANNNTNLNKQNEQYNKKELDDALKKINNFLKDENTRAEYDYYKDLKTTTIKIIDVDTKEVLLEVPPKKILDMVASMMRQVGLLDKKA
ncbi:flagellar protein FlaG [Clostridium beijerinckii]|uniref:Flagellar protein FlaG n=2 Tax=Clostridium beijerinckii TaxID=1520 RepID=A0A9Q5GHC5_CLOBE|nr:flagellar protein FlaG [Clostridium beijerinckii]AQS07148.1 flagellar protein FlaG [Clostridium beijerinckii]MBA2883644.1 flagellar protein FlaG [Clostridium beijerinckii]MBA2898831.1 flagellar protein FlaG [Clostridium beijerinckii]MBA2908231.1 flagellar protein FlaG [Clostridium beijerinckii]MBA9013220.1 flagellar protein FlaG [Clostridium beijerinckii]